MKRSASHLLFLSAALWLFALMSPMVSPAWAEVEGNCEATFKDVNVRGLDSGSKGDKIDVDGDEVVVVNMTSPVGFASHKVKLEIAGASRTISNKTDDGDTQWSETVNVKDYAWLGAGLYKVIGSATLTDGSTCSGAALINVKTFPLATVAGGAAAVVAVVGVFAMATTSVVSAREGDRASAKVEDWVGNELAKAAGSPAAAAPPEPEWTIIDEIMWQLSGPLGPCLIMAIPGIILTGAAMATPQSGPPVAGRPLRRRARWLPRITVAGVFGGLLAGLGIVVLLQQFAVMPLTLTLLIEGLVAGLILGIVLPSLGKLRSVMRVNATVARAEELLSAARASRPGPPPQMPPEAQS